MHQGIAVFADLIDTIQRVLGHQPPGGHRGQQVSQRRLCGTPKHVLPSVPQAGFKLRAQANHVRPFQMRPQIPSVPAPQVVRGQKGGIRVKSLLEQFRRHGRRQVLAFDGHDPIDALLALAHAVASNWWAVCTKASSDQGCGISSAPIGCNRQPSSAREIITAS